MLEKNKKMAYKIIKLVNKVKFNLSKEINNKIIYVYWNNDRIIVSNENQYNILLECGKV